MKLAKPLLMGLLACLCSFLAQAQTKTITGKVTDSKHGKPMVGASITVKGTSVATQTGADGTFRLNVPASAKTLTISSVGYAVEEVSIQGTSSVQVSLKPVSEQLSDIIVIGYGTRKVKDATGSVAALTAKDFNKGAIATPEQLLQGRTPGVIVTPASGEPGAAATINIRGSASIRGNQEPLYVVDGVPISPGGTTGNNSTLGSSSPRNPLS
uniref:carboxypeptidase-like regulatory domain-containing protein n=1 Tax=Hafnia paralvei TaxID=546367 RepID=UPI0038CF4C07